MFALCRIDEALILFTEGGEGGRKEGLNKSDGLTEDTTSGYPNAGYPRGAFPPRIRGNGLAIMAHPARTSSPFRPEPPSLWGFTPLACAAIAFDARARDVPVARREVEGRTADF